LDDFLEETAGVDAREKETIPADDAPAR